MTSLPSRGGRPLASALPLTPVLATVLALAAVLVAGAAAAQPGDAGRGATLYQRCSGCHTIDDNDIGPKHRGVVGRKAGSLSDYAYSGQLKASGIVWTPETLDKWLTNPQALVPGAKMFFSVQAPQDRADIIAYLGTQK